jgi:hypothetical protein
MIASFFFGVTVGAAILILLALYVGATPPKQEQAKYHDGLPATSISMSGKPDTRVDAFHARQLNEVLRNYEGTRQ